jgi:hypothetical protein
MKRGVIPTSCVLCDSCLQTVSHLLFECSIASSVWADVCAWLGVMITFHNSIRIHFSQFTGLAQGNQDYSGGVVCNSLGHMARKE